MKNEQKKAKKRIKRNKKMCIMMYNNSITARWRKLKEKIDEFIYYLNYLAVVVVSPPLTQIAHGLKTIGVAEWLRVELRLTDDGTA